MKKIVLIVLLIVMLVLGLMPSLFAAEKPSNEGPRNTAEETTGILPTNPFYFLKELGRGVKSVLKSNPVSKAEYQLQVAGQKVAELKKLKELYPNDSGEIKTIILNYSENIKQILEDIKVDYASIKDKVEEVQLSLEALN